jgi:hypothetical protein
MGAGAGTGAAAGVGTTGSAGAAGFVGAGGIGSAREATMSMVGQGFLCGNETSGWALSARTAWLFPSALAAGTGTEAGAEEGVGAAALSPLPGAAAAGAALSFALAG